MFLPLHDGEPLRRLVAPRVTWAVIAVCCVIFVVFQSGYLLRVEPNFSLGFGMIPSLIFGYDDLDPSIVHVPAALTPLTYQFLHGSFIHLAGNMLFLWVFGDNVEDEMGHGRYIVFLLLTGAIAGFAYALTVPTAQQPLIGASGSVAAVLGAYLVRHPNVRVLGLFLNVIPVRVPAIWMIGGWFLFQLAHALFDPNRQVAWVAHVAGLLAGAALVNLFRQDRAPLHPVRMPGLRRG